MPTHVSPSLSAPLRTSSHVFAMHGRDDFEHWPEPRPGCAKVFVTMSVPSLSRANYMHSDAASQGGSWWQGCGAAYYHAPKPLLIEQ